MKKLIYLFIIIGVIFACTKKSNTKTENPAKSTIAASLVVDSFTSISGGVTSPFEFGNKFYASRNGKITKLGCKMPVPGNYRVSLWNFTTTDLITATTIITTDSTQFQYNDISAVEITANTRYVISINNTISSVPKRYFLYYKYPFGLTSIYPFTSGSITFETLQEKASAVSVFPDVVNPSDQTVLGGVPDMQFEYTE